MLQYADDTIFLFDGNLEGVRNLKFLLCIFEHITGLKINFHKSEVYCFGNAVNNSETLSQIFTCKIGTVPFKYLGIPVHNKHLSNADWKDTEGKVEKKLGCWKGKLLSNGGRLTLLNSSLTHVPSYMMSLYVLPKGVKKHIDYFRTRLLWQEDQGVKKYHLVSWQIVCQPKEQGGLGVVNLTAKNILVIWVNGFGDRT